MFFSFDGIDGAGKSTQIAQFVQWLQQQGHDVVTCRDPGTTHLGEAVRGIVLGADFDFGFRAEMLLYMACRAQLVHELIQPALDAGKIVVSDRFLLASVVYQGVTSDLSADEIWSVGKVATNQLVPDLTFVLDLPPEQALARLDRSHDRIESRGLEYFRAVRDGFREQAEQRPDRHCVLDAARAVDEIQADVQAAAARMLRSR